MRRILLITLFFLLAAVVGCSAAKAPDKREPSPERAAVAIMCQRELASIDFTGAADLNVVQTPCCSGFALRTATGYELLTAAHCVSVVGAQAVYVPKHFWDTNARGYRSAIVRAVVGDVAELTPSAEADDGLAAVALIRGPLPVRGDLVRAVRISDSASGKVLAYWGATDLDIYPGWSGAAVVNAEGQAVGLIKACAASELDDRLCETHTGFFAALPAIK